MNKQKLIDLLFVLPSLILSIVIVRYYWMNEDLTSLVNVSLVVMLCAFVYVIVQMLKRYYTRNQSWWDWLYYIGLAGMMLPNFFADQASLLVYNKIADFGTLFLVIPQLIEGWMVIKTKKR